MAELKTIPNDLSVTDFIDAIEDDKKRVDSKRIIEILTEITDEVPKMWGGSIIGFGTYHYVYKSGREGDWMKVGFSPRKQNLTIYIMPGLHYFEEELSRIGKHKLGKSCLYVKKLADIDEAVLREIVEKSLVKLEELYGNEE
ncbi:MAG: DUF1801 domain-containing protein [Saprospiraceae bacterium]